MDHLLLEVSVNILEIILCILPPIGQLVEVRQFNIPFLRYQGYKCSILFKETFIVEILLCGYYIWTDHLPTLREEYHDVSI